LLQVTYLEASSGCDLFTSTGVEEEEAYKTDDEVSDVNEEEDESDTDTDM
jgi:hypothetical protein